MQSENSNEMHDSENELFEQRLQQMALFKYTHNDVDFCNARRPVGYVLYACKKFVGTNFSGSIVQKLSFSARAGYEIGMQKKLERLEKNSAKLQIASQQKKFAVILNEAADFEVRDLPARLLSKHGEAIYSANHLIVEINSILPYGAFMKLPRYLAMILSYRIYSM